MLYMKEMKILRLSTGGYFLINEKALADEYVKTNGGYYFEDVIHYFA